MRILRLNVGRDWRGCLVVDRLARWFAQWRHRHTWQYGTIANSPARRHRKTGEVQLILWKAGEQGHATDYWHRMGAGWEEYFIPGIDTDV